MKRTSLVALCLMAASGAPRAQDFGDRSAANPLARFALEDFADTLRRPLFSPTRRPPPPPSTVVHERPPAPLEPPHLTLVGVTTDGQDRRALVRIGPPIKIRSLRRGDEIEGWKVVEIEARRIVFERDARTHAVALFAPKFHPVRTAPPLPSSGE